VKIGVISDTHGHAAAIRRAVAAIDPVDQWLHAGDFSQDVNLLAELTGLPVTAVAGNCDGATGAKIDEFIEVAGKRIWLTHGHRYEVKNRVKELVWWSRQFGADVVIYGHSHRPEIREEEGILIFNPGSAAYPRQAKIPTVGLLEITDMGEIRPSLIAIK
jgi:putative phosphoesterase